MCGAPLYIPPFFQMPAALMTSFIFIPRGVDFPDESSLGTVIAAVNKGWGGGGWAQIIFLGSWL